MKTKTLLMSVAAFLSFGNIAFAGDLELCVSEFAQGAYASAFRYCEKACSLNDGGGCNKVGGRNYKGRGVREDDKQAKTYYEEACSLNEGVGCGLLGAFYAEGRGVKQDYKQAKTYFEKACSLNNGGGCSLRGASCAEGR